MFWYFIIGAVELCKMETMLGNFHELKNVKWHKSVPSVLVDGEICFVHLCFECYGVHSFNNIVTNNLFCIYVRHIWARVLYNTQKFQDSML